MGKRLSLASIVAVWSLVACGCGTFWNMRDGPEEKFAFVNKVPPRTIYGGTRLDVGELDEAVRVLLTGTVESGDRTLTFTREERLFAPLEAVPNLIDLPLSVVGDTATLPVTIYSAFTRQDSHAENRPKD